MSTPEEIKELVETLKNKKQLKPYEVRFLEVYNKKTCDETLIKELQLIGRDKYIERNFETDIKESGRKFIDGAKSTGSSLKGKWTDAPPPPPQFPEDCIIM